MIYGKQRSIILENRAKYYLDAKEGSQMPEEAVGKVSDFFARPVSPVLR